MPLGLERLVYESRATGSTTSLLNLVAILGESQRNNEREGLTGVLAAHGERYVQVVEGSPGSLDRLLRRLANDPRHRDLTVLDRVPITGRMFGRWLMASARIAPAMTPALDALMAEAAPSGERVVALLHEALKIQEAEVA